MNQKSIRYFPRSKFGAVLAVLYLALAIGIACSDRYGRLTSNSFINLQGLPTIAITFPASYLLSVCIPSLNFDQISFFDTPYGAKTIFAISLSIAICTLLVYLLGAALGTLGKMLSGRPPE